MGYACPVCGAEQADGVHLANHLAVTASLDRPDHREWLDEHAPDWVDDAPADLADRVTAHAPEIETPEFASAGGERPGVGFEAHLARHGRGPGRTAPAGPGGADIDRDQPRSDDVEAVLEEARDLTERMTRGSADDRDGGDDEPGADEGNDDER
ncbi:DUF5810 domain-containing protein [Halovivax limisalsi]|uniref:DUF5810 domain-containing protein n=1 Tax=Halovivax limisalsi TaxID=1453760 RepID=UPI001FFD5B63|nr:DUF5810 domain-containing protein [Halovivax limisalsi]